MPVRSAVLSVLAPLACLALADAPAAPVRFSAADPAALSALLWERSPDVLAARSKLADASADAERAHLLPNPELDVSLNNYPVGQTNPPGLSPLGQVVNFEAGLSELVEIGKRGPRQRAAENARLAAAFDTYEALRQRFLDLVEKGAEIASAQAKGAALASLAEDAARLSELERQKLSHGDSTGLDVDRVELEREKLQAEADEAQDALNAALLACADLVKAPCEPFASRDEAQAFLQSGVTSDAIAGTRPGEVDRRGDVQSAAASERAARASLELARARWIPDPTLRAGFVHDTFVVSGNQPESVFLGASIPLPAFDHGQADARAASAQAGLVARSGAHLVEQGLRDVEHLSRQRAQLQARVRALNGPTLSLARQVVDRLDAAVRAGGASLQDLLLARRTLGELLADSAELELRAVQSTVDLARARGDVPPPPPDLAALLGAAAVPGASR